MGYGRYLIALFVIVLGAGLASSVRAAQGYPVYTSVSPHPVVGDPCWIGRVRTELDSGKRWCCPSGTWVVCEPYDLATFAPSTFSASQVLWTLVATRAVTIPVNCTGSQVKVGVNPTAQATITLNKNGVAAGTIVIATNGIATFTCASAITLVAGNTLSGVAPAVADATLADLSITLQGMLQ